VSSGTASGGPTELVPPAGLDEPAARRRVVSMLTAFVFTGTFASVVWHYINAQYWLRHYPWSTFVYWPRWRFSDFTDVYRDAQHFGSPGQQNLVYSPVLHLFTKALTVLPVKIAFGLIVVAFLATLAAVVWKWLTPAFGSRLQRLPHALVLTFFTYPVLFAVDRGNLEMVVFMLLAAFFYLYFAAHSRWAWLPLALAIAAKYYWATLLVLPLLDKQYRQTVYAVSGAIAGTLMSVLAIAWSSGLGIGKVLSIWGGTLDGHLALVNTVNRAEHGHALWGLVLISDRWLADVLWLHGRINVRLLYTAMCLLLFAWVCERLRSQKHADWQRATVLVVCALLLPMENHDYTLIQLFLPLALFAGAAGRVRHWWLVTLLFALLLIPVDYVYFTFGLFILDVSVSVLVYPAVLLALLVVALRGERA
jgi:hypothetical protein